MHEVIFFLNNNLDKKLLAFGGGEPHLEGTNFAIGDWNNFIRRNRGKYIFGFLTYDVKNEIENLKSENEERVPFPRMFFYSPEVVVEITEDGKYQYIQGKESDSNNKFIADFLNVNDSYNGNKVELIPQISREEYLERVGFLKEHIQRGDIYEVTFCQEFYSSKAKIDPVSTYFRLNDKTNAPFSCYVKFKDKHLISGSPERFLKRSGNKLISQPIKGTARRSSDPVLDQEIRDELYHSPKERSENVMIVDLVRNDLSRIAEKNSVLVEELFGVYSFQTVHQLISTVSAGISTETDFEDCIKALFPMGSMTGAPKIRAMELIEKFESFKRGLFSGSVGYFKPNGDFDFNVVIRSILYDEAEECISCPVGGAITIQSDPEQEYEECLLKVEAMKKVLNEHE
ncbi:MAG: anthranilate synthase component I family protein [Brumimicrobium sp.]|nr:anthranilate synthase component I family protein [Brumimicrobium sp.]